MTTLPDCTKCGGPTFLDQIGAEIDVVCRACGVRKEAVARVDGKQQVYVVEGTEGKVMDAVCVRCGVAFTWIWGGKHGIKSKIYCTRRCSSAASTKEYNRRKKEAQAGV